MVLYDTIYGNERFSHKSFAKGAFDSDAFEMKAYDSSTAGVNNEIYGAVVYNQVNLDSNLYGVFPKVDARSASGDVQSFRTREDTGTLNLPSEGGSVGAESENTILELSPEVKRAERVVATSRLHDLEAQIEDDVAFDALTAMAESEIRTLIEDDGNGNGLGVGVAGTNSGTPTGAYSSFDHIVPMDMVIADGNEESNSDDINGNAFADGDLDVYGADRSANEFEAYVDASTGTAPVSDRSLTEALMDDFLAQWEQFGTGSREDAVIVTGYDTAQQLSQIQDDSGVYRINLDGDVGREQVNDAETRYGTPGIQEMRGYKGVPIVASQNVPAHGTISDVFVLDMSMGEVDGEGQPRPKAYIEHYDTPYFEQAGRGQSQGYLATGVYEEQALIRFDHELVVTDASAQGKLRDLQE